MSDFVIELEQNAKDSLVHGIVHYQESLALEQKPEARKFNLKFSILSIFHSIELYLKARLVKAHPILIYDKPEYVGKDPKTVAFEVLTKRLFNVGVDLSKADKNLKNLQSTRNSIEHHRVELSILQVEDYIVKAIRFLEDFLLKELGINLKKMLDGVDEGIYKDIAHCLNSFDARLVIALDRVKSYESQFPEYDVIICDCCRQKTMVLPNPESDEGNAYCFLCEENWLIIFCNGCSSPIYFDPEDEPLSIVGCADCEGWTAHNFEKY